LVSAFHSPLALFDFPPASASSSVIPILRFAEQTARYLSAHDYKTVLAAPTARTIRTCSRHASITCATQTQIQQSLGKRNRPTLPASSFCRHISAQTATLDLPSISGGARQPRGEPAIDVCACFCTNAAAPSLTVDLDRRSPAESLRTQLGLGNGWFAYRANGLSARAWRGSLVLRTRCSARCPFLFPQRTSRRGLRSVVITPLILEKRNQVFACWCARSAIPEGLQQRRVRVPQASSEHVAPSQTYHAGCTGRFTAAIRLLQVNTP